MKQETILLIILIITGAISLASKIYWETTKRKNKNIKVTLNIFSTLFIIAWLFIYALLIGIGETKFNLKSDMKYWSEKSLLQLDSDMYLNKISKREIFFYSNSKKNIYHHSKIIKFDLFDIYSITDCIKNLSEDKTLEIEFVKSTFYRKEKIKYLLNNKTISKEEFDSHILKWNFTNKLYSVIK